MGKKSGPSPPDPVRTAAMQMDINRQAALENAMLSQMHQQTPFARSYYTGEVGTPGRMQHTEFHPLIQAMLFGAGGGGWSPLPESATSGASPFARPFMRDVTPRPVALPAPSGGGDGGGGSSWQRSADHGSRRPGFLGGTSVDTGHHPDYFGDGIGGFVRGVKETFVPPKDTRRVRVDQGRDDGDGSNYATFTRNKTTKSWSRSDKKGGKGGGGR